MVAKIARRLEGWQAKFLSFGGKVTLIKSFLLSLPMHIFSCMAVPKQIQKRINGLLAAFFWNQRGQHRIHWVSWKRICAPLSEGGLGIRSVTEAVHGLHGKLAWKVMSQE